MRKSQVSMFILLGLVILGGFLIAQHYSFSLFEFRVTTIDTSHYSVSLESEYMTIYVQPENITIIEPYPFGVSEESFALSPEDSLVFEKLLQTSEFLLFNDSYICADCDVLPRTLSISVQNLEKQVVFDNETELPDLLLLFVHGVENLYEKYR